MVTSQKRCISSARRLAAKGALRSYFLPLTSPPVADQSDCAGVEVGVGVGVGLTEADGNGDGDGPDVEKFGLSASLV
jgi:hypothetical protein